MESLRESSSLPNAIFRDRADAGCRLAALLEAYRNSSPVVLGLAPGGVAVAAEVARELDADLDVIVAVAIAAPGHAEVPIGAVGPDGARHFDLAAVSRLALALGDLYPLAETAEKEVHRRTQTLRKRHALPNLAGRFAILVDDGLLSAVAAIAAAKAVHRHNPRRLIFAVPVASREGAEAMRGHVDEVIALETRAEPGLAADLYASSPPPEDGAGEPTRRRGSPISLA